jgi:hypothetical protein
MHQASSARVGLVSLDNAAGVRSALSVRFIPRIAASSCDNLLVISGMNSKLDV